MKFKEYIEDLKSLAKQLPETLEMETIYSHDDEGNAYSHVIMSPIPCKTSGKWGNILEVDEMFDENCKDGILLTECNAVCIN